MSKALATIGDIFGLQEEPGKKQEPGKKPTRTWRRDKSSLSRFAKGSRVRIWYPDFSNKIHHGAIGIVCTSRMWNQPREKYVVVPNARPKNDFKIKERTGAWFLTEEEYTLMLVMDS
jgi:hypothetical protein